MKKIILSTALVAMTAFSGSALAASINGNANVNIISALSISEATEIDFGNIAAVDGTCAMAANGALTGSSADLNCTGTATPASFDISGEASEAVDISVTAGAAVDGVTFTPTIDGGLNTVTLDGSGAASVTVHGSLALSAATVGDKDIAYTFTANYQ